MWWRVRALVIKELLMILRDPRGRMVVIVPPLMQLLIFAFAATLEVKNVHVAVLDSDHGRWSHEIVQRLQGSPVFQRVLQVDGVQSLAPLIDRQSVLIAIHLPQDFSADIEAGRGASLQLILDGRRSNAAQVVQGYVSRIIDDLNQEIARGGQPDVSTGARRGVLLLRNWFNPNLHYHWFTVPSLIGTIGMLVGLSVTALSVARERELGTFDQLLVSPLRPVEIVIGKTLPSLLIGLVHGLVFLLVAVWVFRIPFTGSLTLLFASLAVYLVAVIGIGLFISSLAATQQQGFLGAFVFAAPAILLSGFATPVQNMPDWLQWLTLLNPLRHFLVIVNGVFTKAMPAPTVIDNAWPLLLIAVVTMSVAGWLFRRRTG
ncbi:MAG: ABC transporter permease [Gammaproteobacteria bacterium]|nr:ABC transporter permease [Gammaproteobacteria bacterium]